MGKKRGHSAMMVGGGEGKFCDNESGISGAADTAESAIRRLRSHAIWLQYHDLPESIGKERLCFHVTRSDLTAVEADGCPECGMPIN